MRIREELAGDLAEGNQTQRLYEGPLDRQMALANTAKDGPVGVAIKRMRSSGSHQDRRKLVFALDKQTTRNHRWAEVINSVDRFILIGIAIGEWADSTCPVCKGKKFLVLEGLPRFDCETCHVSGRRRYTNRERSDKFGRPMTADDNRFIRLILGEIEHYDMVSDEATKEKLGRR